MSDELTRLRHRAAASGTGCTSVSIEELNVVLNQQRAEIKQLATCRRLLREACDMPPRLGGVGLIHTVTGDWLRRAAKAAGGRDE